VIRFLSLVRLTLLCLTATAASLNANSAPPSIDELEVKFPDVPTDPVYLKRSQYFEAVLQLALEHSKEPFKLTPVSVPPVPASRVVMLMAEGRFNVAWVHTDPLREQALRPIRIPIFRGLGGWRLLFVREDERDLFQNLTTIDELKQRLAGQGHDWPDTEILKKAGFTVRTSVSRNSLFQLLKYKRIDYFPRGLFEIWDEEKLPAAANLIVENHLAIRYPTAFYLFVDKNNERLANALEIGLERAVSDGSFQALFMEHMGDTLRKAELHKRLILEIPNPLLPPKTPLNRKELWFHPSELTGEKVTNAL